MSDLTIEFEARRVALVGDWAPLFDLLEGRARVRSGAISLMDCPADRAVRAGVVGVASARSVYNPAWTAAGYLEKVAILDGKSRGEASVGARRALASLALEVLSSRTLGSLSPVERLAVSLAQASLSEPAVIALETPFDALTEVDADWLERALGVLAERSLLLTSFADLACSQRYLKRHDYVVLFQRGRVVAHGDPKVALAPGSFLVTVTRLAQRFRDVLTAAGCSVDGDATLDDDSVTQMLVASDAPDLSDRIVGLAVETGAPVIELVPLGLGTALPEQSDESAGAVPSESS